MDVCSVVFGQRNRLKPELQTNLPNFSTHPDVGALKTCFLLEFIPYVL